MRHEHCAAFVNRRYKPRAGLLAITVDHEEIGVSHEPKKRIHAIVDQTA